MEEGGLTKCVQMRAWGRGVEPCVRTALPHPRLDWTLEFPYLVYKSSTSPLLFNYGQLYKQNLDLGFLLPVCMVVECCYHSYYKLF